MANVNATQTDRVLGYMEQHGRITALQAMNELGVMRLAARISEIKSVRHIPVVSEYVTVVNRYGEKCKVKAYRLGVNQ